MDMAVLDNIDIILLVVLQNQENRSRSSSDIPLYFFRKIVDLLNAFPAEEKSTNK